MNPMCPMPMRHALSRHHGQGQGLPGARGQGSAAAAVSIWQSAVSPAVSGSSSQHSARLQLSSKQQQQQRQQPAASSSASSQQQRQN